MAIRDRLLELEQRLKRLAGESVPREPLEIRQAVLQAIVDMAQPAGRGRRVVPYNRIDVDVLAPSAESRRVFDAVFARDEGLDGSARRALAAVKCHPGPRFTVTVHYRRRPVAGWQPDQRFAVSGRLEHEPATSSPGGVERPAPSPESAVTPTVVLKVLEGRAVRKTMEIHAERINIGRQEEVADRNRRLVRRNHVAFVEGDEASDTVSRAHAHIRWASGEFRIRDDGSAYGTRVMRDGRTIEVAAGHSRGVRLQPGDEVHVGRAVLLVTWSAGTPV